jgi:hypothetical protein
MAPKKLTIEMQTFVVQALACFDSPSQVSKAVKEEFGVDITPQAIEAYDPTKRAGREVAKRWRDLFEHSRKKFLEDTASIGIANRAVRLRTLDRMARKAENMGALALVAQFNEQAAKEVGDCYTNRQKHELAVPNAVINLNLSGKAK